MGSCPKAQEVQLGALWWPRWVGQRRVGGRSKGEGMYANIWLSHFIVLQKLTQHCKATISQLESESEVAQSCLTLCDPMDCSLPGSSVHEILQARILEWVAISFSREIFLTHGSNPGLQHCRQTLYTLSHQGTYIPIKIHINIWLHSSKPALFLAAHEGLW